MSGIANRLNADKLMESLIDPGAELAKGFGLLTATLKDGSIISGTLVEESPANYKLRMPDGATKTLERNKVAKVQMASAMPPMGAILQPRELRDLVAYMSSLKSK